MYTFFRLFFLDLYLKLLQGRRVHRDKWELETIDLSLNDVLNTNLILFDDSDILKYYIGMLYV